MNDKIELSYLMGLEALQDTIGVWWDTLSPHLQMTFQHPHIQEWNASVSARMPDTIKHIPQFSLTVIVDTDTLTIEDVYYCSGNKTMYLWPPDDCVLSFDQLIMQTPA